MMEKINPSHYKQQGRKECIVEMAEEFSQHTTFGFCIGNAKKYIYRAGTKPGESFEDDIGKADEYIRMAEKRIDIANLEQRKDLYTIKRLRLKRRCEHDSARN